MRVVQVLTQSGGGPVDHTVEVAVGLARRGVDSHVVAPPDVRRRVGAAGAAVTWHDQEATSKRDLAGLAGLARSLRALAPDVLHLQDRRAGWVGRGLGRSLPGTAVVYTLHGVADGLSDHVAGNLLADTRRRRDRWYYLHGERWITRWGRARVVSPSHAVADFAVRHVGLDPSRVDVVPNGVDPDRFRPAPTGTTRTPRAGERPRLVWLGGLVPVKRADVLVEAVAAMREDVEVLVAGDGELAAQVRELAAARFPGTSATGREVRLLGHVADPAPLLQQADGFVLTSAAESCPMALLQAMATGLPAVATAVGGVPEVWGPVAPQLLCPPGDPHSLASALDRLVADPALRADLGARARERVLATYTTEHCLDGLQRTYATALEERA
ncbi:glycosyltransferase family 4 protein [uncultured Nocardioides sp.]|uniref:glycosyltransferase family 4 protein n=1 Tax=uncultured Nocardioides sp. TaxID=198441 RepID=UPI00261B486D|nr:glycosyltransferase family 4 protein [uncultured Nocardioides sp.]